MNAVRKVVAKFEQEIKAIEQSILEVGGPRLKGQKQRVDDWTNQIATLQDEATKGTSLFYNALFWFLPSTTSLYPGIFVNYRQGRHQNHTTCHREEREEADQGHRGTCFEQSQR